MAKYTKEEILALRDLIHYIDFMIREGLPFKQIINELKTDITSLDTGVFKNLNSSGHAYTSIITKAINGKEGGED